MSKDNHKYSVIFDDDRKVCIIDNLVVIPFPMLEELIKTYKTAKKEFEKGKDKNE